MCLCAENDPFAEGCPDPPRAERRITLVPDAIAYKKFKADKHVYTIAGIYCRQKKGINDDEIMYSAMIPDCESVKLDYDKRLCSFITNRKLTNSELAYAIDDLSHIGDEIPSWLELEARDIPKGEFYGQANFLVKPFLGDFPKALAWFWLDKRSALSAPVLVGIGSQASLRIVPTKSHCMAHSCFSIRILDSQGKLMWQEESTAFAAVRIAISDIDEDGAHEILIDRNDHGKRTRYIIQKK